MADQTTPSILHLTLYGPQEMTGTPQQYGLRLARLCRILLGYSTPSQPRRDSRGSLTTLPSSAILQAEATVHFLQRAYRFVMDATLLNLLPAPSATSVIETQSAVTASADQTYNPQLREVSQPYTIASSIYDSSIEQSFAEAFQSLSQSDGADGWQLEREPEPLLLTSTATEKAALPISRGIFIPDFALTRDNQRIYVEILGYWTPAYRERKIAKLQMLKDRNDLVLAIPREASEAFTSILNDFPIVIYHDQLSATELLNVLRSNYDDLHVRLSQINVQDVRKRIQHESLVPESACYALLHCFRRSELMQAAELVTGEGIAFVPGIGFYLVDSLEQLRGSFVEWLGQSLREDKSGTVDGVEQKRKESLPLDRVLHESRLHWPILASCEDATIEAVISMWPEVLIVRSSIFEATVSLYDGQETSPQPTETPSKKVLKGQKKTAQKRKVLETNQANLWN
ncbi:MAG TPA: DUF790 family protein, partial [Ktedonobacteraceae bacterium]|nr:DUF790 family protein [Ktedonobacteraceae bacterium]